MPQRRLLASSSLVCLVLAAGCFNEAKAPSIPPSHTLTLAGVGAGATAAGRVGVIFSSTDPVGVVFDRPMRTGSATLAGLDGRPVRGAWRWVGQSGLVFSPERALPLASEYGLSVAGAAEAIDGSTLGDPFAIRFSTARPALASLDPHEGQIARDAPFVARFTQEISAEEVERAVHLYVGDGKDRRAIGLRARPAADDPRRFSLAPLEALPAGAPVEVDLDESLHGTEGPLPSGKAERFTMRTPGPLAVVSARRMPDRAQDRCATSGAEVELSNPVTVRELSAHLRFEPPAAVEWNRTGDEVLSRIDLHAALSPGKRYELVVTAGMKDVYGQSLARGSSRALEVGPEPLLRIGEQEVFAADDSRAAARTVGVESANLAAYDLLALPLNEAGLARYFAASTPGATDPLAEASRLFPQAKVEAVHRPSAFAPFDRRSISLDALLSSEGRHGAALFVAESQGPTRAGVSVAVKRLVTQTDLRVTARVGPRGGVAWVHRLSNGKPVSGAVVAVRDPAGAEVASAHADDSGRAVLPAEALPLSGDSGSVDPRAILVARSGDDWTFRPLADDLEACGSVARVDEASGVVVTDRERYELGDTIQLKVFFRGAAPGRESGKGARSVRVTLTGAGGNVVSTQEGKLDAYGGFAGAVTVPAAERPGPWDVRAEVTDDGALGGATSSRSASTTVRIVTPGDASPEGPAGSVAKAASSSPAERAVAEDVGPRRVALTPDKELYDVGDTAVVRVRGPFREADALLVVEGPGAPRGESVHLEGPAPTLRIPVTPDLAPLARVSVLLTASPVGVAPPALGEVALHVAARSRRLSVTIVPSAPAASQGGPLEADVLVRDSAGAPSRASVAFFAVDDPSVWVDPTAPLDALAPSSSYWIESRADMGAALLPTSGAPPGTVRPAAASSAAHGGVPGTTAFFDGSLLTDIEGRVHVRFTVPPTAERLRLRAVAATEDARFGAAELTVDTSPALGVEIAGPAVVRAGDRFELRATISSRASGGSAAPAEVTLAAIGLDVGGAAKRAVTLSPGARVEIRWPVLAAEVRPAEVVVSARSGDQSAQATWSRKVQDPSELESSVVYGEAAASAAERLAPWEGIRLDDGALDLKVSVTPLVGLDDGLEQILDYPYEDTEQHATRLLALAGMPELLKDFAVDLPADNAALVDREIAALLAAQRPDGSFAEWPGAKEPGDGASWRSAYALWTLNAATIHDHPVPADGTNRAVAFVRRSLQALDRTPRESAEAAFALDVLTDLGLGDGDKMLALFEAREHLPLFVRALLAHAMTVQQMDESKVEALLADLDSNLRTTAEGSVVADDAAGAEYRPLHDSSARATAMLLRALVARAKARAPNVFRKIRPSELTARVARGLLSLRRGGTWRTPEETAWALRALDDFRTAHVQNHADVDALFYLNDALLLKMPLHDPKVWETRASFGMRKVVSARAPGATLGFRVEGDGIVRYEARLRYASTGPVLAIDRGLAVDKRIEARGAVPGIRLGDRVSIELLVVSPLSRDHVVIDDPLPGGLVAVDVPSTEPPLSHVDRKDGRVVFYVDHLPAGMTRLRYTARAETAGRYVVPSTKAACLFEPEVVGRTVPGQLDINP